MRSLHLALFVVLALGCTRTPLGAHGTGGTPGDDGTAAPRGGQGGTSAAGSSGSATSIGTGTGGKPGYGGSSGISTPGTTTPAALFAAPPTVNLGTLDLGRTGTTSVMVTNSGGSPSGPLIITSSAGLTATGCTGALGPNKACLLAIAATPASAGAFAGTVTIAASPGAVTPLVIGVAAAVSSGDSFSVVPSIIDFGPVPVGAVLRSSVTVTAKAPITDLSVLANGSDIALERAQTTCTGTIATGASCTVVVSFLAVTAGSKSASIDITGGGKSVSIPVLAIAQSPAKLVTTASPTLTFTAAGVGQTSSSITVGIANLGELATSTVDVAVRGPDRADFAIQSNTCLVLPPLGACAVELVFKPGASDAGATRNAFLVASDRGTDASSLSVPLIGTLAAPAPLIVIPALSDASDAAVGATGRPDLQPGPP